MNRQALRNQEADRKGGNKKSLFTVDELIAQLIEQTIKQRPKSGLKLLVQQRVNHQVVEQLLQLWHSKKLATEIRSEVFISLEKLTQWLADNSDNRRYKLLATHFILLEQQIKFSLTQAKPAITLTQINMPPGSPIGS